MKILRFIGKNTWTKVKESIEKHDFSKKHFSTIFGLNEPEEFLLVLKLNESNHFKILIKQNKKKPTKAEINTKFWIEEKKNLCENIKNFLLNVKYRKDELSKLV